MAKQSVGHDGAADGSRRGRAISRDGIRRFIGHEIRRARLAHGLRLVDVGRWIKRGTTSVHEYETGQTGLEAADLIVLAARLGIDMAGVTRMIARAVRVESNGRRAVARCGVVR